MGTINLSNSKGRDALVSTESVSTTQRVRWLDERGRQAHSVRLLKATLDREVEALGQKLGGAEPLTRLADALIAGDPEVDIETVGCYLRDTSRVYVNSDGCIVHAVTEWELLKNPDGSVRERRPRKVVLANVTEVPLKWSGKLMKKAEVYNRFVFASKLQLAHINGLTYDFLYEIAKELEQKDSLVLIGAGPKANQPLVFYRGGTPYRGFLEGRTQGDSYCLILHLSNMELKAPAPAAGRTTP